MSVFSITRNVLFSYLQNKTNMRDSRIGLARAMSTMQTQMPGSLPEHLIDPYRLLDDDMKTLYDEIRAVRDFLYFSIWKQDNVTIYFAQSVDLYTIVQIVQDQINTISQTVSVSYIRLYLWYVNNTSLNSLKLASFSCHTLKTKKGRPVRNIHLHSGTYSNLTYIRQIRLLFFFSI